MSSARCWTVGGPVDADEPTIELPAVVVDPQPHRQQVSAGTGWVEVVVRVVSTLGHTAERLLVRSMLLLVAVALAGAGAGTVPWDEVGDFAARARRGIESLADPSIETATEAPDDRQERSEAVRPEETTRSRSEMPGEQRPDTERTTPLPVPPAAPRGPVVASGEVEVVSTGQALTWAAIARLRVGMTINEVVDTIGFPGIDGGAYPIRPKDPAVQRAIDTSASWDGWEQMVWPADLHGIGLTVIFHHGLAVDITSTAT